MSSLCRVERGQAVAADVSDADDPIAGADTQCSVQQCPEALRGLPDGTRNCIALILMHGRWRVASIYEWDEEKRLSTAADPAAAIMAAAKALEKGDATDDH